jgi:glutathione S-transferase
VLLTERGIPFEERLTPMIQNGNGETFRAFSPSGKVPCLVDEGTVVWDSMGITEYLAERHEGIWPADRAARAWARCAAAEMHSGFGTLREVCTMNVGIRVRLAEVSPALARDVTRLGDLWNEGLDRFGGPFLAGAAFSAVDAFFAPVAFRVRTYGVQLNEPAAAYSTRLLALPAMHAWEADALLEKWREPAHEAEARRSGELILDLRADPDDMA